MVAHHRQSIEIAELASVPANEASEWLPPLAERIQTERLAEIEPLEALLAAWGVAEGAIEQGGEPAGADGEAVDGGDTADTSVTDDEGSASLGLVARRSVHRSDGHPRRPGHDERRRDDRSRHHDRR
ncbi:MAG: DUF305 domain-containing protein [Acidimicrobiales bacterium]